MTDHTRDHTSDLRKTLLRGASAAAMLLTLSACETASSAFDSVAGVFDSDEEPPRAGGNTAFPSSARREVDPDTPPIGTTPERPDADVEARRAAILGGIEGEDPYQAEAELPGAPPPRQPDLAPVQTAQAPPPGALPSEQVDDGPAFDTTGAPSGGFWPGAPATTQTRSRAPDPTPRSGAFPSAATTFEDGSALSRPFDEDLPAPGAPPAATTVTAPPPVSTAPPPSRAAAPAPAPVPIEDFSRTPPPPPAVASAPPPASAAPVPAQAGAWPGSPAPAPAAVPAPVPAQGGIWPGSPTPAPVPADAGVDQWTGQPEPVFDGPVASGGGLWPGSPAPVQSQTAAGPQPQPVGPAPVRQAEAPTAQTAYDRFYRPGAPTFAGATPHVPTLSRRSAAPAALRDMPAFNSTLRQDQALFSRAGRALPVGGGRRIATLFFEDGSSAFTPDDREVLRAVADLYRRSGGAIRIEGHASRPTRARDRVQHNLINYDVSGDRGDRVAQELVRLGVPAGRIMITILSDNAPEYAGSGGEEAANRRVVLYLVAG